MVDSKLNKIEIDFHRISMINPETKKQISLTVFKSLEQWQKDVSLTKFLKNADHLPKAPPITIILDTKNREAYIKGKRNA